MQKNKFLYINTIGCQMNVHDSERIAQSLAVVGYQTTSALEQADAIIVNTCAIRAKAEQKAYSFLGRLAELKQRRPDLIIGVGGCVAQQEGQEILKRMPHVDFAFGTHAISRLASLVEQVVSRKYRLVDVAMTGGREQFEPNVAPSTGEAVSKFVTIMQGCDNFCSYCVVPYVRGREVSRDPESILAEVRNLVRSGVREVTLLGQNVNSYGIKEGLCAFSELIAKIHEIDGLERLRFTTSHPKDFSDELIGAFETLPKLCRHIHLPVQSGSNRILRRMNRKYTREDYLEKVSRLRRLCPDIAITSDFIAGFPGETTEDFRATLDLMRAVRFDNVFAFTYSDRPNAPAAHFSGRVSEEEKSDRLAALLALQKEITARIHAGLVGSIQTILVDGLSKKQARSKATETGHGIQWTGRTSTNKIVNFATNDALAAADVGFVGKLMDVKIEKALPHSLWGRLPETQFQSLEVKGDENYAA